LVEQSKTGKFKYLRFCKVIYIYLISLLNYSYFAPKNIDLNQVFFEWTKEG